MKMLQLPKIRSYAVCNTLCIHLFMTLALDTGFELGAACQNQSSYNARLTRRLTKREHLRILN